MAVAAVAIFIGWLVGQYAIQSVTGPVAALEPLERPADVDTIVSEAGGADAPVLTNETIPTGTPSESAASTPPSSSGAGTESRSGSSSGSAGAPTEATTPPSSSSSGGVWRVQAGAFSERDRAESLVARLHARGFEAAIVSSASPFRVQVGAFSDEARARSVVQELHADGFEGFLVAPN